MKRIVIGICNGSLEQPTLRFLEKIGVCIQFHGRAHETKVSGGIGLINQALRMRPQAIPKNIERGIIFCAIMGFDWLVDYCPELLKHKSGFEPFHVIAQLQFARTSRQAARVVLVRKKGRRISPATPGVTIYAEYEKLARHLYPKAQVTFSPGSTEAEVAKEMFDFGLCVTETGETLRASGLVAIPVLESPVVLVSRERTDEIEALGGMLSGALEAESLELVKVNAATPEIRDAILGMLPALSSPTVSALAKGGYAIEAVVPKRDILGIFIALRKCGATGWVQHNVNVVVR